MDRKTSSLFSSVLLAAVLAVSSTASAGVVGWWSFDGDATDLSGNANHGTLVGNPSFGPGMLGSALDLNGSGQNVEVPDNPSLHNFTNQITVTAWINPLDLGNSNYYRTIVAKFGPGDRKDLYLYLNVNLGAALAGPQSSDWTTNIPVDIGAWAHVALTYDGSAMTMYKNGIPLATTSVSGNLSLADATSNGRLFIGYNTSWIEYFSGRLDDVRIYNKALSGQQVQDLITKGTSPTWTKAFQPTPADGAVGVGAPLFTWGKGDTAMFHNVYLGTSPDLTEADLKAARWPATTYYYAQGLLPGTTYYWRVDEVEKDTVTIHTGDVWSFVSQALTAYYPQPADGANTASTDPTLTWLAGAGAIGHHVYFGDDLDAVTQGAAATDKGTLAVIDTAFTPEALESLKTYYWRVDESVPGGIIRTGPVWKFTTTQMVDDFESYTDDVGSEIFSTWVDGYSTGLNGSMVGYVDPPFAEQTIFHGGLQSMPLDYNNVAEPFYSETVREFATAQNWTANGIDTLVLFVQGRLINSAAPLYVALEDTSKKIALVACPDPTIISARKWTEWKIPLSGFTGVNPSKVKKLYIGVGDRQNPVKGGLGLIYIDDICLARS